MLCVCYGHCHRYIYFKDLPKPPSFLSSNLCASEIWSTCEIYPLACTSDFLISQPSIGCLTHHSTQSICIASLKNFIQFEHVASKWSSFLCIFMGIWREGGYKHMSSKCHLEMEVLYFSPIKKGLNKMFYKLKIILWKIKIPSQKDASFNFLLHFSPCLLELITYKALTLHSLKAGWRVLTILKGDQRLWSLYL